MSRYELTVDSTYVQDWGLAQALRELYQNAIDANKEDPSNTAFFNYYPETETLEVGNKKSVLNIESLLLGCTTKAGNNDMIGQFGEGYKLATLVLLRLGKTVTFYNYGNKEVWNTKLIKSRRFNGRLVPIFDIDKKYAWQKVPHSNLIVEIKGITPEEYETIKRYILQLNQVVETLHSKYGTILLDECYRGDVYVNGLFVRHNDDLHCGYDIPPAYMSLDRDRQTVIEFDLLWHTSRMWLQHQDHKMFEEILFSDNPYDVRYISSWNCMNEDTLIMFYEKYGRDVIPVSTQDEFDFVKKHGGKPVIVHNTVRQAYASLYNDFSTSTEPITDTNPYDALEKWFDELTNEVSIPDNFETRFKAILERYEDILTTTLDSEEDDEDGEQT